jgi:hypothetical protein
MDYIIIIAITWLLTKLYYTGKLENILSNSDLIDARCFGCSCQMFLTQNNIRAVNYCNNCK